MGTEAPRCIALASTRCLTEQQKASTGLECQSFFRPNVKHANPIHLTAKTLGFGIYTSWFVRVILSWFQGLTIQWAWCWNQSKLTSSCNRQMKSPWNLYSVYWIFVSWRNCLLGDDGWGDFGLDDVQRSSPQRKASRLRCNNYIYRRWGVRPCHVVGALYMFLLWQSGR